MREVLGAEVDGRARAADAAVYTRGRDVAASTASSSPTPSSSSAATRDGAIILIDEVMTPDSSRFWPADGYRPGQPQPSFDKQPLRDWLDVERHAGRWNGEAPPPKLPPEVVDATSKRYLEAYRRLTGEPLSSRRHRDVVVAQALLEIGDRLVGTALVAVGDRAEDVEIGRHAAVAAGAADVT